MQKRFHSALLRRDAWWAALLWAVGLIVVTQFSAVGFDTHHTGLLFRTALGVVDDRVLFRETFTQYGALTVYLHALGILLFGRRVRSILFVTALFYAGAYCLFFLLCRRFLPLSISFFSTGAAILLAPFFFWDFHPWSSVFSLFFLLLSTHALLFCIEKSTPWPPFWAGVFASLAFWARQPVGMVCVLGGVLLFCFFALLERRQASPRTALRQLAAFLCGTLVGLALFLVPIAATGALADFYRQSIAGMLTFAAERSGSGALGQILFCLFGAPLDSGKALWHSYLWALLPLCTLALCAWCLWRLLRVRAYERHPRSVLICCVMALGSWHQYYPVFCQRHWYWGGLVCILPTVLFLRLICLRLCKKEHTRQALCALLLFCVFGTGIFYRVTSGTQKLAQKREMVYYQSDTVPYLRGLWLRPAVAEHFDTLWQNVALLQTHFPDRNVVNLTDNAFYELLGEEFYSLYAPHTDSVYLHREQITADYIRRHRPIVIANHAPDSSYVLWRAATGDHADDHAAYHDLPADLYLPVELYDALPTDIK